MSERYKGGIISATPPTTSTSAASGVWTLRQQAAAKGNNVWPLPVNPPSSVDYLVVAGGGSGGSNGYSSGVGSGAGGGGAVDVGL